MEEANLGVSERGRRGRNPSPQRDGESDDDYRTRLETNERNRERYAERRNGGTGGRVRWEGGDLVDTGGERGERTEPRRSTRANREAEEGDDTGQPSLNVETPEPTKKPKKGRPTTKKVIGADVEKGVKLLFDGVAMFSGKYWWRMPDAKAEVGPWSSQAAELLNKIPTTYIKSAIDMSGYLAVGIGIFRTVSVRVEADNRMRAEQARSQAENVPPSPDVESSEIFTESRFSPPQPKPFPSNVRPMSDPSDGAAVVSLREPIPGMMTGAVAT